MRYRLDNLLARGLWTGAALCEALVISDGVDANFAYAASATPTLRQIDISKLGV
jgi:hypothetical protein